MVDFSNPHNLPKVRSDAIMKAAKGVPCQLRISNFISGHTCSDDSTCVMAHPQSFGKGVNTKVSDLGTIIACYSCHELLDGRDSRQQYLLDHYPAAVQERVTLGILATLQILVEKKVIVVPDGEIV